MTRQTDVKTSTIKKRSKLSEQWKLHIKLSLPRGEKHPGWKGTKVSYGALHVWLKKTKGKAIHCEKCGDKSVRRYNWANVDHKYSRNLEDYISLCVPCHRVLDGDFKLTKEQIGYIRDRLSFGEKQKDLAKEYGVDQSTISLIKNNKRRW